MGVDQIGDPLSHSAEKYPFELSIKNQGLKLEDAHSCQDLCQRIQEQKCLKVLRLEGNTLGVEAALFIGKALKGRNELERLIMNDIFTGRLKTEIPKALENLFCEIGNSNVNLIELNLSDNAFGPIGMGSLMSILKNPCCQNLQELRLHNNGLGIQGAKRLADVLKYMSSGSRKLSLKTLICGRNRLENEGAAALASALKNAHELEEIQMPQNGIRAEGTISIFEALEGHANIRLINFNDNTISDKGSFYIAKVLPGLTSLEQLNIGDCLLQDQGASEIATAIVGLSNLKFLDVSANEIEDRGALDLLDGLKACRNLKFVCLDNNNFGEEVKTLLEQELKALSIEVSLREDNEEEEEEEKSSDEDSQAQEESNYSPVEKAAAVSLSSVFAHHSQGPPIFAFGAKPVVGLNDTNKMPPINKGTEISAPAGRLKQTESPFNGFNNLASNLNQVDQTQGQTEFKQIKRVRRRLSAMTPPKADPKANVEDNEFYFEIISLRQKLLDPSSLGAYLGGMLSIAALVNRPGLDERRIVSFIDETIRRLGTDIKTQMAAADTISRLISCLKCPALQRKQAELVTKFVVNNTHWAKEVVTRIKANTQRYPEG